MTEIDQRDPTNTAQSAEDKPLDEEAIKQAPNLDKDELDEAKLDGVSGGMAGQGYTPPECWDENGNFIC